MKTIKEHNEEAHKYTIRQHQQTMPAGVACDKCGTEMNYTNFNVVLASYPPKKTVVCPNCNYLDYMVV